MQSVCATFRTFLISAVLAGLGSGLAVAADLQQGSAAPIDRYGGGRHYTASSSVVAGPRLTWPGKIEAGAPPVRVPATMASPSTTPVEISAPAIADKPVEMPDTAQDRIWAPSTAKAGLPPQSPGTASRLYSVHREFGMSPDPVPAAPLTFTASADLAGEDASAAEPQPNRNTAAGRISITAQRINDTGDGQP